MLPTSLEDLPNENNEIWACIDEVGRGCMASIVTAAVVIWPLDYKPITAQDAKFLDMIKDSKKVTEKNREKVAKFIKENAVEYSIASIDNEEIDEINILQATYKAMHNAIDNLNTQIDRLIIDGNRFKPYINKNTQKTIPYSCVIGGDNKLLQIAAASILAKTYRDEYISNLEKSDETLKVYNWSKNKGYGTAEHIKAIKEHGLSKHHRKSFIHFI